MDGDRAVVSSSRLRLLLYVAIATAAILLVNPVQRTLTDRKDRSWNRELMTFVPSTDRLRPFLLGFDEVYADYLWIRTMLYFGGEYQADRDFRWLAGMVDMVTRLNPKFYPAYEFAGVILPGLGRSPDAARVILERGLFNLGSDQYRIAFYLGWLYYDRYHDLDRAGDYLSLAARHPKSPPYLAGLAATVYRDAGKRDLSVEFLHSLRESTQNPAVRKTVEDKLRSLGVGPR